MMEADPEPMLGFTWSTWNRCLEGIIDLVFWGCGTVICTVLLFQFGLIPDVQPKQKRFHIGGIAALIVTPVAIGRRFLFQYHTIVVYPDLIEFRRSVGVDQIRPADVIGLVAQPALNADRVRDMDPAQGELIVWQKLYVLTEFQRFGLPFGRIVCPELYLALRQVCSKAWGLPYPGDLEPPAVPGQQDGSEPSSSALGQLRRFYRKQVFRTAILGFGLLAGGAVLFVGVLVGFFLGKMEHVDGRTFIGLPLMMGAGLIFLRGTPRDFQVLGMIRDAEEG